MSQKVRVRFAPSPTGPLHIGGVRTALYNYLFAKHHGGDFLLRIEDTDQTRFVPGAEEYIQQSLSWCGITPDEGPQNPGNCGPYRQSERKDLYYQYAEQLINDGYAYYAFDTPEELENVREMAKKMKAPNWQYNQITRTGMKNSLTLTKEEVEARINNGDPYVIRLKAPRNEEIRLNDLIRGWVVVNSNNIDDKVLMKADKMPTYHLANIVDDHLMDITHVIRGEEWLPSAPTHVLLYQYLGWNQPDFAHLPLILKPDGNGKLSKRDGDRLGFPVFPLEWKDPKTHEVSSGYRESGYFADGFVNMLAFLGWNPGDDREIFSLEELISEFSLERVGKAGAKFDADKAKWYNQQYLRSRSNEELEELLRPYLEAEGIQSSKGFTSRVCGLMKERASFIPDMLNDRFYFEAPTSYDEKTVRKKWKEDTPEIVKNLRGKLEGISDFSEENIDVTFKKFLEDNGYGFGKVMPGFRLLVTGKGMGPSMSAIASILGKEEVLKRIDTGLAVIEQLAS
ncbi:MAG: glutamate--tRNA ligase [Crocinitomicaceae bacterium]|nr:glutamate--tRNA ligase [Crocinitomicaceae bacterium]|tara:strand:+ start:10183 stop:11712 length:1530 start_codon:yes stop_codon:yes gene_type:complete